MFKGKEVKLFSKILNRLNNKNYDSIPGNYKIISQGGGKDAIPHFALLSSDDKKEYIIWVRGTRFSDPNDIWINMMTNPIDFYQGQCHRGYANAAMGIIELIKNHLEIASFDKIVCLGHSLGGAVSSVIATILTKGDFGFVQNINSLKEKFKNRIRALVFGTPPVFTKSIIQESKTFIVNIINKYDFVPKLGKFFNALATLQRKIATFFMLEKKCLGKISEEKASKISNFENDEELNPNQIPGEIHIIDLDNISISKGKNDRKYKSVSDILGILYHSYDFNYSQPLMALTNNDDEPFKIHKKKVTYIEVHKDEFFDFYLSLSDRIKKALIK